MNLYYHFYSGIKTVSLDACIAILNYFRKGIFTGVFASEYIQIVEDFYNTRIWKKYYGYYIENNGFLRTLRLNTLTYPDIINSDGIIGFYHYQGQTYVHLNGQKKYKLVISDKEPTIPYLRQATMKTGACHWDNNGLRLTISGFGKGYFCFGGLKPNASYKVLIKDEEKKKLDEKKISADPSGNAIYATQFAPPSRILQLELSFE